MALEDALVTSSPQPPVATDDDGVAGKQVALGLPNQLALDQGPAMGLAPESL